VARAGVCEVELTHPGSSKKLVGSHERGIFALMEPALAFSLALYLTGTLVVRVWSTFVQRSKGNFTLLAVLSALSWGLFYYLA
jgi:hypothetical protein